MRASSDEGNSNNPARDYHRPHVSYGFRTTLPAEDDRVRHVDALRGCGSDHGYGVADGQGIAVMTATRCPDCHHAAHRPGQCPQDNCGEQQISHAAALESDKGIIVTAQMFKQGGATTLEAKRIQPRKTGWD